ncbi:MAG TPA: hypothetical protein VD931_11950 [Baekduia sp.]|nr:hypothetical protein [Baekduia sp.]
MSAVSFTERSFQVVDGPMGAADLVLGTLVTATDARALGDALAWRRNRDFLAPRTEEAGAVLELRALVELIDHIDPVARGEQPGPLTLTQPQVVLLAETAAGYVHERGDEDFSPAPERDRLARLGALTQPLLDLCSVFHDAQAELRAHHHHGR